MPSMRLRSSLSANAPSYDISVCSSSKVMPASCLPFSVSLLKGRRAQSFSLVLFCMHEEALIALPPCVISLWLFLWLMLSLCSLFFLVESVNI
ncbi:hypothetical protein VTI28DRAFT_9637 [Corynascus sepedonium]